MADLTGKNISDTYTRLVQVSESQLYDGAGGILPIQFDSENVIVSGTLTAQTYVVSESIVNASSGSTIFGNSLDDTHTFTGNITASNITASNLDLSDNINFNDTSAQIKANGDTMFTFQPANDQTIVGGDLRSDDGRGMKFGADSDYTIKHAGTSAGETRLLILEDSSVRYFFGVGGHLTASSGVNIHLGAGAQGGGEYRGESANITNITASAISASVIAGAGSGDTQLNVQGQITASGNISSSGTIEADNFISEGKNAIENTGVAIVVGNQADFPVKIGRGGTSEIELRGPVTASGTISASGTDTNFFGGAIQLPSITKIQWVDSNQYIYGTTSQIQIGGDQLVKIIASNNLEVQSPVSMFENITASGHITASGNISSSGTISADIFNVIGTKQYRLNGDKALYLDSTDIYVGHDQHKTYITSSGVVDITGNITASGTISASGALYGTDLYLKNQAVLNYSEANDRISIGNKPTLIQGNATASQNISSSGVITAAQITASDININDGIYQIDGVNAIDYASSTHLFGSNTSFTKLRSTVGIEMTAPITASGDISASGQVYDNTYHQWEASARVDSDDDSNWQAPSGKGILATEDWAQDFAGDYDHPTGSYAASRLTMNTGWYMSTGVNYSASLKSMEIWVQANSNQSYDADTGFTCSLWYSNASDVAGEYNQFGSNAGTFVQRHAAQVDSGQFKNHTSDELFKYNTYLVTQSIDIDLAPGSWIFPRFKTFGSSNFVANVYWTVNYCKKPL